MIGKVVRSPAVDPSWYRVNELWFDSVPAALKAFNSQVAVDATNYLMPRVKDFTPVFVKVMEVKLPSPPKKARKAAKEREERSDEQSENNLVRHASIKVEADGKTVFFDPCIEGNPVCPIKLQQIKKPVLFALPIAISTIL